MRKIFLTLAIALGMTSAINIQPAQAQFRQLTETVVRNASQPSEALINLLLDWRSLQGQRVTLTNVNVFCLSLTCISSAGGQSVALKTEQIDRDALRRILACSPVGCAATVSGTVERLGNVPILYNPEILFTEEIKPIATAPKTPVVVNTSTTSDPRQSVVNLPPKSNLTCQQSIDNVKSDLIKNGFFKPLKNTRGGLIQPKVRLERSSIQKGYSDFPPKRIETVTFEAFGATRDLSSKDLLPQKQATLAAQIMAHCPSIGIVGFAYAIEGWSPVGYFPDNTARTFINSSPFRITSDGKRESVEKFEWGYYFSP